MSEQDSRRQFLISSSGLIVAAGCGAEESSTGGGPNEPIGDPDYYPNTSRMPEGPMDNNMPVCGGSTAGLTPGPMAANLAVNQAMLVSGNLWIARDTDRLFAVDVQCTHQGCITVLNTSSQNWVCPCHGSKFSFDGSLLFGPAARPLPRYYVCKGSDGRLYIDKSKPI